MPMTVQLPNFWHGHIEEMHIGLAAGTYVRGRFRSINVHVPALSASSYADHIRAARELADVARCESRAIKA
jgi:hypothetical protein